MNRRANARSAAPSDRRVSQVRNAIIGSMLVLAAVVIGVGLYYTFGSGSGELTPGKQYAVIEDAPLRKPGEPIVVHEFFSYACPHCRDFDPMLEEWKETIAEDVRFERIPATFSPIWTVLAQTYYALEELGALNRNHDRIFRAIHDTGRQFTTIESMADFVDGFGTTREAFLAAANGAEVRARLREADRAQRTLMIGGVPTLVIAGRYVVGMREGRKAAIEIMDELIARERAGTLATGTGTAASTGGSAAESAPAPAATASERAE